MWSKTEWVDLTVLLYERSKSLYDEIVLIDLLLTSGPLWPTRTDSG